ncbi:MAG: hypothetical protein ACLFNT_00380 [Spirochaetales bacterium]
MKPIRDVYADAGAEVSTHLEQTIATCNSRTVELTDSISRLTGEP